MKALGQAIELLTRGALPKTWANVQFYIGQAYELKGDFTDAAAADEYFLEINPTDLGVLKHLSHLDHEQLFQFDRALELDERRLKIDISTAARLDVEEASLTAADFTGCIGQAEAIREADSSARDLLVRDTFKLACQWGAGQKAATREGATELVPKAEGLKAPDWEVTGTRQFLASSPVFGPGRASWVALFDSLENGDGTAMANSSHQIVEVMRN